MISCFGLSKSCDVKLKSLYWEDQWPGFRRMRPGYPVLSITWMVPLWKAKQCACQPLTMYHRYNFTVEQKLWEVIYTTGTYLTIMNSIFRIWKLFPHYRIFVNRSHRFWWIPLQNLQCLGLKSAQPITTKFCTRHDSIAVVTCAQFCCDGRIWYEQEH